MHRAPYEGWRIDKVSPTRKYRVFDGNGMGGARASLQAMEENAQRTASRNRLAIALLVILMAPLAAASGPVDDHDTGSHIKTHFRIDHPSGAATGVFAIEDVAGEPVAHVYVWGGTVYASDGEDASGQRPALPLGTIGAWWHRLDIILHGATYWVSLDGGPGTTARTTVAADAGRPAADPHAVYGATWPPRDVEYANTRVDDADMAADTTFAEPLEETGFSAFVTNGAVRVLDQQGHMSPGILEVRPGLTPGLNYASTPIDWADRIIHAEADFTPLDAYAPAHGIAVIAGLELAPDDPHVLWAIRSLVTGPGTWAFAFEDPGHVQTIISPDYEYAEYHTVRVTLDNPNHRAHVQVDDGPLHEFWHYHMPLARTIALGEVDDDTIPWVLDGGRVGVARYDNVAVYGHE